MFWPVVVLFALVSASADASSRDARILGGAGATIIMIPYQATIQAVGRHICGGVIITNKHILTSAACLEPYRNLAINLINVRVGSSYRYKTGWLYDFTKIVNAPDFVYETNHCDVAVGTTKYPITFSIAVKSIEMISAKEAPKKGDILQISGWGLKKESDSDNYMELLQFAIIPFTDSHTCSKVYKWLRRNITETMLCAGVGIWGGGGAAYTGDGGGPLTRKGEKLVGIISWGHPAYPSVFTSVVHPKVRGFIESVIKE